MMFESAKHALLLVKGTRVFHPLENTASIAPRREDFFGMFPRAVFKTYTPVDIGRKGEINA